jgi:hypothetical protein
VIDCLAGLPVPEVRYFDSIGSTNNEALQWAEKGAPDGALVVADMQTAGRGRMDRRWVTIPGAALAFSLILRPHRLKRKRWACSHRWARWLSPKPWRKLRAASTGQVAERCAAQPAQSLRHPG